MFQPAINRHNVSGFVRLFPLIPAFSGGMKTSGFPRIPPVALLHPVSQVEDRALGQGLFIAVEKFQAQRLFGGS